MRNRVKRDSTRPRLSVFRSHQNVYAQIIDDEAGRTLVSASTLDKQVRESTALRRQQGRRRRGRQGDRRAGAWRPASRKSCSTAASTSITAASPPWPTPPARQVWSSNVHISMPIIRGLRTTWQPKRSQGELIDKVVKIRRCAAVVKGGRRFSFTALVVVGDGQGKVGWGYGKANEVPPAVEKAVKDGTRQHGRHPAWRGRRSRTPSKGRFGAAQVILVPGQPRYGRDRRRRGACRLRGLRHPRHPHQELRLDQSRRIWSRPPSTPAATALPQRSRAAAGSLAVMNLNDVHRGIQKHKTRKRVGRGPGSGHGKTAGRGHKGQGQLAGYSSHPDFRRRPDALGSPHSQARFQQPLGQIGGHRQPRRLGRAVCQPARKSRPRRSRPKACSRDATTC